MSWSQAGLAACAVLLVLMVCACWIEAYTRKRRALMPDPWMKDCKRNGTEAVTR